jgi:K(+)-stimulated pyrophosphate-energized sodium pump
MSSDLFESYVGSIISAMAIGVALFGVPGLVLPLMMSGIGIIVSIAGSYFVRVHKHALLGTVHKAFKRGIWLATVLACGASYPLAQHYLPTDASFGVRSAHRPYD